MLFAHIALAHAILRNSAQSHFLFPICNLRVPTCSRPTPSCDTLCIHAPPFPSTPYQPLLARSLPLVDGLGRSARCYECPVRNGTALLGPDPLQLQSRTTRSVALLGFGCPPHCDVSPGEYPEQAQVDIRPPGYASSICYYCMMRTTP